MAKAGGSVARSFPHIFKCSTCNKTGRHALYLIFRIFAVGFEDPAILERINSRSIASSYLTKYTDIAPTSEVGAPPPPAHISHSYGIFHKLRNRISIYNNIISIARFLIEQFQKDRSAKC